MSKILSMMMLEEWRMHSLLMGNNSFSAFPLIVVALSFVAAMMMPLYMPFLAREQMAVIVHMIYLFFGLSVGGFGLLGREVLNRRLGDVSLIAYSSRSLPVSEHRIFIDFVLKDTIYYLLFLVAPFLLGYAPARVILGMSLANIPHLAVSLTLIFLLGIGVSFLLSTIYAHYGKRSLAAIFALAFIYTLANPGWISNSALTSIPQIDYYLTPTLEKLITSLILVILPFIPSFAAFSFEYRVSVKRYTNQFSELSGQLGFTSHKQFLAKDLLDLNRSEGGLGKVFFSYLFPLAVVAFLMSFFSRLLPIEDYHFMLIMALMTGVVSTNLYSWLAEYDFIQIYEFLPISTTHIIRSKLILHAFFATAASIVTVSLSYIYIRPPPIFLPLGFIFAMSVGAYVTSITMYLTGLRPNVLLYSGRIFILFSAATMIPLLAPSIAFMTGIVSQNASMLIVAAYATFMIPTSYQLISRGCRKWDSNA